MPLARSTAARLGARLWWCGKLAAAVGLYACVAAVLLKLSYVSDLIAVLGGALLLLAAALFDGCYSLVPPAFTPQSRIPHPALHWLANRIPAQVRARIGTTYRSYRPELSAIGLGLSACVGAYQALLGNGGNAPRVEIAYALALSSALLGVLLIVAERWVAALEPERLAQAHVAALSRLLRVPIAVCALGALATFAEARGHAWAHLLLQLAALGVGLVAIEIMVRTLLGWYDPRRRDAPVPGNPIKPLVDSLLVGWLRPGTSPWQALCDYYAAQFGIDLRQSWGMRYILRAAPGFLLLSAVLAYALSAVTELQPNQRGIYERFGRPVEVFKPGLHLGLPWPFGQVMRVENGVLHEVAVIPPDPAAGGADLNADFDTTAATPGAAIDAAPPASANRLWDSTHAFDTTQLIAGQSNERESFQIMNVDARFVYRVGASDQDALAASYQVADLPTLIRDLAGRALIRQFSSDTLTAILGESQEQMASALKATLQGDLNRLHSGVEIVAVVIEAIHPPGGAANAYHDVQAAELEAQALVFAEQGQAAQTLNEAMQTAAVSLDLASASAAQSVADAHATALGFDAAQAAYRSAGEVFLREEYLHALDHGLPRAQLIILDHRIADSNRATIDLRNLMSNRPDLTGALPEALPGSSPSRNPGANRVN